MNTGQQMRDPSAGVPMQLLPHMHLISKHRYPQTMNPSLEMVVGFLLEAPKIMNEVQPVQWQLLDCPTDGTIMLTWQPPDLGTNFASDGYVWNDQEAMFNSDVRGCNLQMYLHRSGFRPGADAVASHSRRRYRLMPSQQNVSVDPSIWLVHYSKSNPRDHVPTASIQISSQVHTQMQQRRMIFSQGALPRKEFMLRDRNSWPTINAPGALGRHGSTGQAASAPHRRGPSIGMPEPTVEEEEDVSRGDALDFMTPRDVSRMRYEQHHEWMEEILESAYPTLSIIPPELGLGRKGELESLTSSFFDAPITVQESSTRSVIGKMDPGKAEEFTKAANQRLADMQAELNKMRQAHQKRMEKLKKSSTLGNAERTLRHMQLDDAKSKTGVLEDDSDRLDQVAKEAEESIGKKITTVRSVHMVSKGGFQADLTSHTPAVSDSKGQAQLNGSDENENQRQPQKSPVQSQNQVHAPDTSTAPTNEELNTGSSSLGAEANAEDTATTIPDLEGDIEMGEFDDEAENIPPGDAGDWVMVEDQDLSFGGAVSHTGETPVDVHDQGQTPTATGLTSATHAHAQTSTLDEQQRQEIPSQSGVQSSGQTPLDTTDFDLGNDFENTAGDALANFDTGDELGLDGMDDMNNMDDSAFGDAFPPQD